MNPSIRIKMMNQECLIVHMKGSQFPNKNVLQSLKIAFILANSDCVDPDEMPQFAAFHLGLHYLPQYPFRVSSIQSLKGESSGSVAIVECLTQDRGVAGSNLTSVTGLCP